MSRGVAGPSVWHGIRSDPTTPFDPVTLAMVVRDQQRPSRRWVYPWLRHVSRFVVALIRLARTVVPVRVSAHSTMDRLCVWFLRRFVSAEAGALLMRHFAVETNLLNAIAALLTGPEYERAVHSMRLDDSVLALLAHLTGDPTFLRWSGVP
jgi:hypothetical protein